MTGYTKRSTILRYGSLAIFCPKYMLMHKILCPLSRKQDADDQKRKLNCLLLLGPVLNTRPVETDSCTPFLINVLGLRTGVHLAKEDIAFSEVKKMGEEKRSAFIR